MSFKYQAQKINDFEWLLERGVSTPIRVFMNQTLYDQSEEEMWRQATWATSIPSVQQIILTADSHVGAGVPVGIIVATKDHVAPCAAGFDISCGMLLLSTTLTKEDIATKEKRRAVMKAVEERVSLGIGRHRMAKQIDIDSNKFNEILQYGLQALNVPKKVQARFEKSFHRVDNFVHYADAFKRGSGQLSSLGGGNHFIELQQDSTGKIWIMIHTGSRGYGHQIATDFFNEGLEWWNLTHPDQQMGKGQKEQVSFPVDSDIGKRYLNAMNQAANFAIANRYLIAQAIIESVEEVFMTTPEIYYEISHNLVQLEDGLWVHRKGATRALTAGHPLLTGTEFEATGHPVLIPGSMGTASAVLMPVDSKKSLYSVNHGCGRVMARGAARRTLDQAVVNKEMDDMDILYNNRDVPIDESFHCYKGINDVLDTVAGAGLAKVIINLKPRAVIKGND
jgi:tRNA-splicing ligase RtcB